MKSLKLLVIAIVMVCSFAAADAQVRVSIGRPVHHRTVVVRRPVHHRRGVVVKKVVVRRRPARRY